jgi:hypothetical protein
MVPYESTPDAVRRQLRVQELCETAEQETDFERLAQIVEEILSLLTEQAEHARTAGDDAPQPNVS